MALTSSASFAGGIVGRWANCCPENEESCRRQYVRIDASVCGTWVYPSNYPPRDYQVSIVKAALLRNTLVCLPTGLGKTLIAAVLMYNYYRWFPEGQIVFMAPTKPLVAQQVEACHKVVGIPECDTAEISGTTSSEVRRGMWAKKRVFYATPQCVANDLESGVLDARRVVLVVVDEAHRAQKKYAYCGVIRAISRVHCHFRVLALSATPGSSKESVQDVVDNLRIAHVEVRTEDDTEVAKHTHTRLIEKVVCEQTSDLEELGKVVCDAARPFLARLERAGAIRSSDASVLTSWTVLKARNEARPGGSHSFADFVVAQKLVAIHDSLKNYGASGALEKLKALKEDTERTRCRMQAGEQRSVAPGDQILAAHFSPERGSFRTMFDALSRASTEPPKTTKLRELLREHFERARETGTSSRAMVFTGTRDSVRDIVDALEGADGGDGLLRCVRFTGQNGQNGMDQREQKAAVARFQANEFNVLVATSVAEEGLDIGQVDLCVFYNQIGSPVRLVQRMGRTGRKRTGRVVLLLAPGEDGKFDGGGRRNAAVVYALREAQRNFQLRYALSKRMLPRSLVPRWPEMVQTKLYIDEWHASQVAGVADAAGKKKKGSATKQRNVVTVDDAVASWRLDERARLKLEEAEWDKDWSYKPIPGDGWRRNMRATLRPLSTVVGDVVSQSSVRAQMLRDVAHFTRDSQYQALYDANILEQYRGTYEGVVAVPRIDVDECVDGAGDEGRQALDDEDPWGWNFANQPVGNKRRKLGEADVSSTDVWGWTDDAIQSTGSWATPPPACIVEDAPNPSLRRAEIPRPSLKDMLGQPPRPVAPHRPTWEGSTAPQQTSVASPPSIGQRQMRIEDYKRLPAHVLPNSARETAAPRQTRMEQFKRLPPHVQNPSIVSALSSSNTFAATAGNNSSGQAAASLAGPLSTTAAPAEDARTLASNEEWRLRASRNREKAMRKKLQNTALTSPCPSKKAERSLDVGCASDGSHTKNAIVAKATSDVCRNISSNDGGLRTFSPVEIVSLVSSISTTANVHPTPNSTAHSATRTPFASCAAKVNSIDCLGSQAIPGNSLSSEASSDLIDKATPCITEDQRLRIERNKERARRLRAERAAIVTPKGAHTTS